MVVTCRAIRASAMSEFRLNLQEEHLQVAEACLAVRMGGEKAAGPASHAQSPVHGL